MIAPEHQTRDDFWDVKAEEAKVHESYDRPIGHLQRVIKTGKSALALRHQPGFEQFLESLTGVFEYARDTLLREKDPVQLPRLQGQVQALSDVVALLDDTEKSVQALEARLKETENAKAVALAKLGQVITNPRNDS